MNDFVSIKCYKCPVTFGMDRSYYEGAKQAGPRLNWFCPNGHEQHFTHGPGEAELLRKERDTLKQQAARLEESIRRQRERAEAAERSASAQRGVVTRLKNRAAAGVCPCCNRTFVNLQRHMAGKHPGFTATEEPAQ